MERDETDQSFIGCTLGTSAEGKMNFARLQQIEAFKAEERIRFYLGGGSRLVFIGRNIIAAVVAVIWVVLWWRGY